MPDGILVSLNREAAKQLFANKSDSAVWECVERLIDEAGDEACNCGSRWQSLQDTLSADGPDVLAQCLLGRSLYRGDDRVVAMIRPDLVPHVAEALEQRGDAGLAEFACFAQVQSLYHKAAQDRHAVLFAVGSS